MKPWSNQIRFGLPLRAVRVEGKDTIATAPAPSPEKVQAEALRASYEQGRIDGEKSLSEALVRQRAELHAAMEGALKALRQAVPQVVRDTENALVGFAMSVAQKLVGDLPISVPVIEAAVRDAVQQVEGTAQFTIRLHPSDLQMLQQAASPALTPDDGREFRFLPSPEVTRGGCMVQTQFGTIDARRETKFDLLKAALAT